MIIRYFHLQLQFKYKLFHIYMYFTLLLQCAVPENIHTPPTEGIGISRGVRGSVRQKNLKKCMKPS